MTTQAQNWTQYLQDLKHEPNPVIVSLVQQMNGMRGSALDLGAGNMRDAKYLLSRGFKVVAVDSAPASKGFVVPGIEFQNIPLQAFRSEANVFSLVISCSTLFHLENKQAVRDIFGEVYNCLVPGGVFFCNLLSLEDRYFVQENLRFSAEELTTLCDCFGFSKRAIYTSRQEEPSSAQWGLRLEK